MTLLEVKDLTIRYASHLAVWEAGFTLDRGEVLGLVGESGAGKSTLGRALPRVLLEPGRIVAGAIVFKGRDLMALSEAGLRALRSAEIALVPQDPFAALNPAFRIGLQTTDALTIHRGLSRREAARVMTRLFGRMGIADPEDTLRRYPHELSGGIRQRVLIAIAFSCGPSLLVADEPTTSLDVTTQAQILRLLDRLRRETGVATCFITHDLGIVAHLTHRVAILYAGCLIEQAPTEQILTGPLHPYTQALVRSLPLDGVMPALHGPPDACPFRERCSERMAICDQAHPPLTSPAEGHQVACHLY
jgi:peptide/nickel transport system ATP-binding protein